MHGLVVLDENDNVIRPAILWNDGRTQKQTDYLNNEIGKDKLSEYKIFKIVTKSVDIENLHEAKDETKEIKGVSSVSTSKAYIEANAWQAQKGTALKEYAKEHGIKLEEVIAIGDNENDTSMLEIAEIQSIAMGNAVEDIKKICKYETKRNDEDGVAYVISHLL